MIMKNSSTIVNLFLVFLVFASSQFGFYREIELGFHQVTEHQAVEHGDDHEHGHSHGDSHHHDEKSDSDKSEDQDTNTHDHSDELNFYSSHSQFVSQNHEAIVFFNALPNYSDHFLLFPITYDYENRISRPPCVA